MGKWSPPAGPEHHNFRHGQAGKSRLYRIWQGMKNRCRNAKQSNYAHYGARGIRVCEDWDRFEPFQVWALANGYADNMSIERIDVDGHYHPDNCKWIPLSAQPLNTRRVVWVTIDGERMRLKDAAKHSAVPYTTACERVRKGMEPLAALELV